MKISKRSGPQQLLISALGSLALSLPALAEPSLLRSEAATYEIEATSKDIVIDNKSELKEAKRRGAINLPGLGPGARIWLKKGSKLHFRGNANIRIASGSMLALEPNAWVILKAGAAGVELADSCLVPAGQIVIVDAGKLLGSQKNAPLIYAGK